MTGSRKRMIYLAMGIIAGMAAFAAVELLAAAPLGRYLPLILMQGAVLGLIFGFTFGFSDAVFYGELRRGLVKAGLAAGLGAVTVTAVSVLTVQGMLWSAGLLKLEYGRVLEILLPLWRSLGWMVMGMAVGSVDGIFQRSGAGWRRDFWEEWPGDFWEDSGLSSSLSICPGPRRHGRRGLSSWEA